MPLHLLPKKSWNVYNQVNRDRVARDEALAEAAARDEERSRRDEASSSRIDALRDGSRVKPVAEQSEQDKLMIKATRNLTASSREVKKRKRIPGEDDTDRDLREAREQQQKRSEKAVARLRSTRTDEAEAPMVDEKGYINLFPERKSRNSDARGRRSELEKEQKQQRDADEGQGMQLKDAWGYKNDPNGAWYLDRDGAVKDSGGKDVWGNEDPRRRERQAKRVVSSDPLAFMKQVQTQMKEGRRERDERARELQRYETREEEAFDDFSLDAKPSRSESDRRRSDDRTRHKQRRNRDRSRSRSREKSRHRHRKEKQAI